MANFVDELVKDDHLAGTGEDDLIAGGLPQEIQEGLRDFIFMHLKKFGWNDKNLREYLTVAVEQWHKKFLVEIEPKEDPGNLSEPEKEKRDEDGEDETGQAEGIVETEILPEVSEGRARIIRQDSQFNIFKILVEKGEQLSESISFVELSETIESFKKSMREFFYFTDKELDGFVLKKMETDKEIELAQKLREAFSVSGEGRRRYGPN